MGTASLGDAPERALYTRRDRIDRFTLRAPVLVVDPISLIMAADQSGSNEIRDSAADVGTPRMPKAGTNLFSDHLFRQPLVGRQHTFTEKFGAHLIDHSDAARIALCHWHQGIAQPVPDRDRSAVLAHIRAGAVALASRARDQVEDHEGGP